MSSLSGNSGQETVPTGSDDNNVDKCAEEKKFPRIASIYLDMLHFFKESALMLLLFATYAALTHNPPKITKSPVAFPFFEKNEVITDYFRGDIVNVISEGIDSDITFFMFYAPWDAESQDVRTEFELVAQSMKELVTFNAVNCWQPGSECKNNFINIYKWPFLFAYLSDGTVVRYYGPKTAAHMIKFLQSVLNPYLRIDKTNNGLLLTTQYDVVITAYGDTSPNSAFFSAIYGMSLKLISKDLSDCVLVTVISALPDSGNLITMKMWNETLIYPYKEVKVKLILKWITKNLQTLTAWVEPSGLKSYQLSERMQKKPTLILFTPYNPLRNYIDSYSLFSSVAHNYYNCNNNRTSFISETAMAKNLVRKFLHTKNTFFLEECSTENELSESISPCVIGYSESILWRNGTDTCKLCDADPKFPQQCNKDCVLIRTDSLVKLGKCRKDISKKTFRTSMITNDSKSSENLIKQWKKYNCKFAQLAENYHPQLHFDNFSMNANEHNIDGAYCKGNRTLSMVAMDSLRYHQFAERLGVDILNVQDKTALIIINEKEEVHHVYKGILTGDILVNFIMNFTNKSLPRASYASSIDYKGTHTYPIHKKCTAEDACVEELDSSNFYDTISEENKVVIVFYHSKQCSFCMGISYMFLTVAKIFSLVKSIKFARIDGELNTLSWEYTMDTYPTVLFFPAKRKSESRAFPQDIPINVPNLLSFILANLDTTLKLKAMWSICNQSKHIEDRLSCMCSLRIENLSVIEKTLKEWRMSDPRGKRKILHKLQQLKSLHLQLALVPNNGESVQMHLEKLGRVGQVNVERSLKEEL